MKIGIVLQSNKPEHIWNSFRFSITALKANHKVKTFLMNEGAELESVADTGDFDISNKIAEYKNLKGEIYACATCLEIRKSAKSKVCPIATMKDLLKIVESSDKVLVFG